MPCIFQIIKFMMDVLWVISSDKYFMVSKLNNNSYNKYLMIAILW